MPESPHSRLCRSLLLRKLRPLRFELAKALEELRQDSLHLQKGARHFSLVLILFSPCVARSPELLTLGLKSCRSRAGRRELLLQLRVGGSSSGQVLVLLLQLRLPMLEVAQVSLQVGDALG